MFYVYILKCADQSYYTGHTDNLEKRLLEHHLKIHPSCYTATRLPLQLVFSQEFASREEALASERQIKGWSRRKKEALIERNWEALSTYAKRGAFEETALRDDRYAVSSGRTARGTKARGPNRRNM